MSIQEKPQAKTSEIYVPGTPLDHEHSLAMNLRNDLSAELPVPPHEHMEYRETSEQYLSLGKKEVDIIRATLSDLNFDIGKAKNILEFGVANARLLRWFADLAGKCNLHGVDIQSDKIFWCIENLYPWFNFSVCTTVPHLPFRDGHFDFAYAGSVFTHLGELHSQWFFELTRVVQKGSLLYLTFIDERSLSLLETELKDRPLAKQIAAHGQGEKLRSRDFDWMSIGSYGGQFLSQVIMTERYIRYLSRSVADVVEIVPRGFSDMQTSYVFRVK